MLFLFLLPFLAVVKSMFSVPSHLQFLPSAQFISQSLFFFVHAPPMTQNLGCAACLAVNPGLGFFFKKALIIILLLSVLQYHASLPMFANRRLWQASSMFFDVFWARILHTDRSATFHPRNLPTWTVTPRSCMSQKTAPAGPQTFVHEVASHTCLLHASLRSSSHFPMQPSRAQKHVAAHASSCSMSRFMTRKSESETESSFPAVLVKCLRNTSHCVGAMPRASELLAPLPSAKLSWYLSSCKLS